MLSTRHRAGRLRSTHRGRACAVRRPSGAEESAMSLEQTLNDEERLADLDLDQLKQLVGLVEYDASTDPFPVIRLGRPGLGRSATRRRPRTSSSPPSAWSWSPTPAPRPATATTTPSCCASGAARFVVTGRLRPGQPAGRPPPRARRRHRRHRAGGARRRPLHRARPRAGRDRPRGAARRHRRARHRADRPRSPPTATPGTPWSTAPATPAPTCPATSRGRRPSCKRAGAPKRLFQALDHVVGNVELGAHGRVGRLLQPGHGLHQHGRVHRRRTSPPTTRR